MKQKLIVLGFLLIFCGSFSRAQLLWEVTKHGCPTSYVFGTHHLIEVSVLDSIDGVFHALNSCDCVIGEIVISAGNMNGVLEAMKKPVDVSWTQMLSVPETEKLDSICMKNMQVHLYHLANLQPVFVQSLLLQLFYSQCHTNDAAAEPIMIDSFFQQLAAELEMPVFGLETAEQQMSALTSQSIEEQVHDLKQLLNTEDVCAEFETLARYYKHQQLDSLEGATKQMSKQQSSDLLYERNKNWAAKLPTYFKSNACFVAVGALHLCGKRSVLALLRKKGFTVKPVGVVR